MEYAVNRHHVAKPIQAPAYGSTHAVVSRFCK